MPYKKIKNLDNPLILNGTTYQFIDFVFGQTKAKEVANRYSKHYRITCKIFTIDVIGEPLGKTIGYGIYSTWKRKP